MESIAVLILAAGQGKRMKAALPKVLQRTREMSLLAHVLKTARGVSSGKLVLVVGHKHELVREEVKSLGERGVSFVLQEQQLGTGDAARVALPELEDVEDAVLILYGDVPLIRAETLLRLVELHKSQQATVSLISFQPSGLNSYGRVMRDDLTGNVKKIVEFKDCSEAQKAVSECNSGIYCVDADFLRAALTTLKNDNAQGEYYLTDIVAEAVSRQQTIAALCLPKEEEVLGVNTYSDLALVNGVLAMRKVERLIESGVNVVDPASLFVDESCEIEAGVSIGPNVQILGQTKIAAGVVIEGSALIKDCEIKAGALIKFNVRCESAIVGEMAEVGPFANLRPGAVLGAKVKIGNFVEVKMSTLEQGAKANHLSYLGNCSVGGGTNIGAGTITCNYDGFKKHQTIIGKNVFIGSDTTLVAPLQVGDGALIGAGSTIREDVEKDSLVLTRGERIERPQWAKNFREANKSNK